MRIPGTKLDQLSIVRNPNYDKSGEAKGDPEREPFGYKLVALDWCKDRQFVMIDLASMTRTQLDIPMGGWVENIVGIPEDSTALIVYKNEIVYLRI